MKNFVSKEIMINFAVEISIYIKNQKYENN